MKTLFLVLILIISQCRSFSIIQSYIQNIKKQKAGQNLNLRPLIGIFSQPSDYTQFPGDKYSYIASSYIKYIESAGAQVVPINYTLDEETLTYLFKSLNGILFPGGEVDFINGTDNDGNIILSQFGKAANLILQLAIEANNNGDYFPIWGTCAGFEGLTILIQQQPTLEYLNDPNRSENIKFVNMENSRLFKNFPPEIILYMQTSTPVYFNHQYGISSQKFQSYDKLTDFFYVTSYGYTQNGTEFIASNQKFQKIIYKNQALEGKNYPIYATQWHPEKNPFIWQPSINVNNEPEAVQMSQYTSAFFVNEARKNFHNFQNFDEESKYTIYQYHTVNAESTSFMEEYFFENLN